MSLRRSNTITRGSSDSLPLVPEGNFWDVGNYKPVLKRISNGPKLCDEMVRMMQERASLEKHFAKELTAFAERWEERLNSRVPEYGTLLDGWMAVTAEARQLADIHMHCKTTVDEIMKERVDTWKKEHYKKSLLHLKSYKRASAAFEKAQTPWAKRKEKIDKHRQSMAKHGSHAEQLQGHPDAATSDKIRDNISKALESEAQAKEKLRLRVEELLSYNEIYRREMRLEFERCQAEERQRIEFFKDTLLHFHKLMDNSQAISDAHALCLSRVQQVSAEKDLQQFSRDFGVDMPMIIPDADGNWYLEGTTPPSQGGAVYQSTAKSPQPSAPPQYQASPLSQTATVSAPQSSGPTLVALYDYESKHADELSFHANDTITLDPSAQCEEGWLKGQHTATGAVGIFPGNYVASTT
eukprot:m.26453 g.26453  ORF g.26453 m.26453 type:complete len:410 (+) comp10045_c2_seq2:241-1470(+)